VFYLLSLQIIDPAGLTGTQALVAQLYAFMPTIVLGGLAVFPLTALEVFAFSVPALAIGLGSIVADHGLNLQTDGPALWFMAMMMGLAMFSGMSQLHYMATLVNKAMTDPLTGAYTRRSGAEALDLMFRLATLSGKPLTVAFFDLDHFKSINDSYGHEAGDKALQTLVESLRATLRRGDILARWGGEEFVAILPDMPADAVPALLTRLRANNGLGLRPDGTALTASIGIAETICDHDVVDWPALVELADRRMYDAKRGGRDRALLPGEKVMVLGGAATTPVPA
jgi:diguanylate cyclase (GGDEF)-like protein